MFWETLRFWFFCFFKIPMIFWLKPRVLELTDTRAVVVMPFNRRSKNHLNSMYFSALTVGADVVGGLLLMRQIRKKSAKVSFLFKDLHAEFLKRCEADVHFLCEDGAAISKALDKTLQTKQRENVPVHVIATVPSISGNEPVAKFALTLSFKALS